MTSINHAIQAEPTTVGRKGLGGLVADLWSCIACGRRRALLGAAAATSRYVSGEL